MTLRLTLAALLALGVFGCGDKPTDEKPPEATKEQNCVDGTDDDSDGFIDCDDPDCNTDASCKPPDPKPCAAQQDCGKIADEIVLKVCVDKKCVAPGPADRRTGEPIQVGVKWNLVFDSSFQFFQTKPQSVVYRVVAAQTIDGKTLTCKDLKEDRTGHFDSSSGTWVATGGGQPGQLNPPPDDRHKLDDDRTVNQIYRNLFPISWGSSSGQQVVGIPGNQVPRGQPYLLLGEVWYGPRDQQYPTGNRVSVSCCPDTDLPAVQQKCPKPIDFTTAKDGDVYEMTFFAN